MYTHKDYLSKNITKTLRTMPEEGSRNGGLLTQAGFVSQLSAGIFSMLPLGVRVLTRIEDIVREEMDSTGGREFLAPGLHTKQILEATSRWETIDVLYKLTSRHGAEFCLQATAEEAICAALRSSISSYRDLPIGMYQISEKFRDEHRPRAGLLRGRCFRMKDLYSFHATPEDLESYYESVVTAYERIFKRCGIADSVLRTFASGGVFSRFSDEFQLLADSGEDSIFTTEDRSVAINKEVAQDSVALQQVFGDHVPNLIEHRAIEVGNTFKLGTRFTDAFGIGYQSESDSRNAVHMACYGLGTTRLMGAIAEVKSDDRGLVWPHEVAPYDLHVVLLGSAGRSSEMLERLTKYAVDKGYSVLVDDRVDVRAGEKFADADLIGIPVRVVVSDRSEDDSLVEIKRRSSDEVSRVAVERVSEWLAMEGGSAR